MPETTSKIDSRLWSNVPKNETYPPLIAARRIAAVIPSELWIEENAKNHSGQINIDNLAIWGTTKGRQILDEVSHSPEFSAIRDAYKGDEPNTSACSWPESTKDRVIALFWTRRAEFLTKALERSLDWEGIHDLRAEESLRASIPEARSIAKRMLDYRKVRPFTEDDIRMHVEYLADTALHQSEKSKR